MQKLAGFGMYGKVNSTLLATLTNEQADMLRREMGSRGITSIESSVIKDCRDRHKRAKALGYEEVTFCDRVHEEGKGLSYCIFDDMFVFAYLSDPPRSRVQISAGVTANAEHQNYLSKLIICPNFTVWKDSPLNFASLGRKFGFSCLAATSSRKKNMSGTSAGRAHIVAFWPGSEPSKCLLMGRSHSSKSCMRKPSIGSGQP